MHCFLSFILPTAARVIGYILCSWLEKRRAGKQPKEYPRAATLGYSLFLSDYNALFIFFLNNIVALIAAFVNTKTKRTVTRPFY